MHHSVGPKTKYSIDVRQCGWFEQLEGSLFFAIPESRKRFIFDNTCVT